MNPNKAKSKMFLIGELEFCFDKLVKDDNNTIRL